MKAREKMTNARDVLNRLIWDKRFDIGNYAVIFVHRGAPHDLKTVKASAISRIEKSFFIIEEDTMIPFHRVRAIRDLRNGNDIYTKEEGVPFPLEELQGHEDLGQFEDRTHSQRPKEKRLTPAHTIQCGARLSFPEDEPASFGKRANEGAQKFGMVELSFFHYSGDPEESEKYESIIDYAGKIIVETQLNVSSLHLPNINITSQSRTRRMLSLFLPFCTQIGCRSIVVHPGSLDADHSSQAEKDEARSTLRATLKGVSGQLEDSNVILSIETYPERNRVPSGTLDMLDFLCDLPSCYRIAYDTSHTIGDTDSVIEEIVQSIEKINVFHFSNRSINERHIPIFGVNGDLDFAKIIEVIKGSGFNGMIVLEYQPKKYRMLLERDLKNLRDTITQP
jgi:uncharacterized protein (UPF0248 family)/sugar phosphate isomerase/epimerase